MSWPKNDRIELPSGVALTRFMVGDQKWACGVWDHSPAFCRLCQPVDEVTEALINNTLDGLMDMVCNGQTGELSFRVTEEGFWRAGKLIQDSAFEDTPQGGEADGES